MSENTKIEWCDHTSQARNTGVCVRHPMAVNAKRLAIANVKASIRVVREWEDMVRLEVAATVITAVDACKTIALHHLEAPAAPLWRRPQILSILGFPVHVAMALLSTRCSLASALAYERACLRRVLRTRAITSARLGRSAHLGAALCGHH